jgi:hypothetical protein
MARAFATLCIAMVLLVSGSCHARSLPSAWAGDNFFGGPSNCMHAALLQLEQFDHHVARKLSEQPCGSLLVLIAN